MAQRVADVVCDLDVETLPERHHFDPPHRIEPRRLAEALRALWQRANER